MYEEYARYGYLSGPKNWPYESPLYDGTMNEEAGFNDSGDDDDDGGAAGTREQSGLVRHQPVPLAELAEVPSAKPESEPEAVEAENEAMDEESEAGGFAKPVAVAMEVDDDENEKRLRLERARSKLVRKVATAVVSPIVDDMIGDAVAKAKKCEKHYTARSARAPTPAARWSDRPA
ncbi:MAG: hypothetical protein AAF637_26420 [Pseudomonadota bacterium]